MTCVADNAQQQETVARLRDWPFHRSRRGVLSLYPCRSRGRSRPMWPGNPADRSPCSAQELGLRRSDFAQRAYGVRIARPPACVHRAAVAAASTAAKMVDIVAQLQIR